jgi:hypothetical protein
MKRTIASLYLSAIFAAPAILFPIPTNSFSPPVAAVAVRGGRRPDDATNVVGNLRRDDRRMMGDDDAADDDVDGRRDIDTRPRQRVVASSAAGLALALLLSTSALTSTSASGGRAFAYDSSSSSSDYASETVTNVVKRLGDMAGNVDGTYGILEDISMIITEGKGVGGTLTYGELISLWGEGGGYRRRIGGPGVERRMFSVHGHYFISIALSLDTNSQQSPPLPPIPITK